LTLIQQQNAAYLVWLERERERGSAITFRLLEDYFIGSIASDDAIGKELWGCYYKFASFEVSADVFNLLGSLDSGTD